MKHDVIIIGAGAAGLFCAMRASNRGRSVLVLDHGMQAGSKILISGGGRCNFTNRYAAPDRYISKNPHFCISALQTYGQVDFVALIEKHKIPYHEKTLGQLFCDRSAEDIVQMLVSECRAGGVTFSFGIDVQDIQKKDLFEVTTSQGMVEAKSLVLATGGLSVPKMGASNFAHKMAERFGLSLTETRPALVPLVFDGAALDFMRGLAGVSLDVDVASGTQSFRESMIFTHRGLSGPAVLQASSYWREGEAIIINLLPNLDAYAFLIAQKEAKPKAKLKKILSELLPHRLAQALVEAYFPQSYIAEISNKQLREVADHLNAWKLMPKGTEGYEKAEVTLGGVAVDGLSSKSMEAKKTPGLYVIGEAVDVTGWLGGYNLQWSWSSGYAAGSSI